MQEYELSESQPGQFEKIVDGKPVRMATEAEVAMYHLHIKPVKVESGIIEVSLALSAVLAIVFAQPWTPILRIFAGVAFCLSFYAAMNLYGSYLIQRIPTTLTRYYKSKLGSELRKHRVPSALWIWSFFYFPQILVRSWIPTKATTDEISELPYLTLFVALLSGGILVILYVVLELF